MEGYLRHAVVALSILQLFNIISSNRNKHRLHKNIRQSRKYPRLCYNSLSISAGKIQTNPKELVHTSLNVTLAFTQATSVTMKRSLKVYSLNHNASAALVDSAEELGDMVEMLQQSIEELGRVDGASSSRFQLSNIQTWVSAAFTNEDTCEDGFANLPLNGKVETTAHRHVTKAAHLTSNALALVNAHASAKTASP